MTTSDAPLHGKLTSHTRRDFIRGIAAAGASTAGVVAAQSTGLSMFAEVAEAHGKPLRRFRRDSRSGSPTVRSPAS